MELGIKSAPGSLQINYSVKFEKIINKDVYFLSKWKKRDLIRAHCKIGSRRPISPVTRNLLKNIERKLLNKSIVKNYSKRWKQTSKLKNVNQKLVEVLNVKEYIDHETKVHQKLVKVTEIKKNKLEHKFNKMLGANAEDNFNINQKDKEAHIQRTVLHFSQVEVPKDCSDLLSKGLDYKVEKKRLPLLDIISGTEDATENILATYTKTSFRVDCLNISK